MLLRVEQAPPTTFSQEVRPPAHPQSESSYHFGSLVIGCQAGDSLVVSDCCLACGSADIVVQHPLFEGGLCFKCKENFIETLYRYDEDGYQSYCTVCCGGTEVILCGNASCCRCFCKDCVEILVGRGTFRVLKDVDPWSCYICQPAQCEGNLKLRPDWSVRVQDLFANNSAMEFVSILCRTLFPSSTQIQEMVVLQLAEWGPFDLLIGGSPCNDLSMGTGRLFFEFYRILTLLKPKEGDDRPFFWLFENVVFMSTRDKTDICRFLEVIGCDCCRWGPLCTNLSHCCRCSVIFGFPKHYTDVNNMGRMQRQRVLGRSWSVAVIRHLMAPLKDYFECESHQSGP
uniref:PHD-type domain-containing protein n=1 Tax=Hippocampus comes TaxID=109280 RepID=A0A3Q2YUF5_HIPCM